MDQKRCALCGETRPLDEFHRSGKDGRHSRCRVCRAKRDRKRDIERQRERRANDSGFRESQNARKRERLANDPEYAARKREQERERYHNLSGTEYNRLLLRDRRRQARARMAVRNEGRPGEPAHKRQARAKAQRKAERLLAEEIQRRSSA